MLEADSADKPTAGPLAATARALDAEPAAAAAPAGPAPAGPAPAAPAAPAVVDWTGDARTIIDFAMASLTPFFPTLKTVYTPEARAQLDPALGNVFKKYDFDLARLFAKWEPEIRFALVAGPLVAPTIIAVRVDMENARKAKAEAEAKAKAEPKST